MLREAWRWKCQPGKNRTLTLLTALYVDCSVALLDAKAAQQDAGRLVGLRHERGRIWPLRQALQVGANVRETGCRGAPYCGQTLASALQFCLRLG